MHADRHLRVALAGDGEAASALREGLATLDGFELAELAGRGHADPLDVAVLVHEGDTEPREELAQLREHTGAPVVLATTAPSSGLVRWALDAGIADVLPLPAGRESVLFVIEKAAQTARQAEHGGDGRVVTVFSPKGGSGKSVVSTNLAVAAATHAGKKTLLIDLDLQFGDAAIMLGLAPDNTVRELLGTPTALDGEKLGVYTERHSSGVDVLPAPMSPEDAELVGEEAIRALLQVARESYDLVVVDTAPFFYGPMLATLDQTDQLLLLCNPDVPTLKNVRLTLKTLELLSFPGRSAAHRAQPREREPDGPRRRRSGARPQGGLGTAARPVGAARGQRGDACSAGRAGRTVRCRDVGARPRNCRRRRLGRQAAAPGSATLQLWEELTMSLQQRINGTDGFEEPTALQPRIGSSGDRPIDRFAELRSSLHDVCVAKIGPELQTLSASPDELRGRVQTVVEVELDRRSERITAEERQRVVDDVIDEVLGYGPIDPFLRDDTITEVMVNGHDQVFIERAGVLYETDARFADDSHLMRVIERIVAAVGRRVDEASPMVDARLPDGSRVNVIVPPLALRGADPDHPQVLAPTRSRSSNLVDLGTLSPELVDVLEALCAGQAQRPDLGRHGRRQDDAPERPLELHPGHRADPHDRGRSRAAARPGARGLARVAAGQHRRAGRGAHPRPRPERAAHAARPHHRRRGSRRRRRSTCSRR